MKRILDTHELSIYCEQLRAKGMKIGLSHGVFDLLHPGHIQHFKAAKKLVDFLVVSVTAEQFVNKGPGRPIFNDEIRLETLSSITHIDAVILSRDKTSETIIDLLKPDIYFKGSDYKDSADDPTGNIEIERKLVEKHGGKIHFTNEFTSSSSKLINNHLKNPDNAATNWLEQVKIEFTIQDFDYYLSKLTDLKVDLLGEIIIDQYTSVEALGKSSKDPILAFRTLETKIFAGGILAIANNCASWVKEVNVHSLIGQSDSRPYDLSKLLNPNINLHLINTNRPTITKHRFVDIGTNAKLFETYEFEPDDISLDETKLIIDRINFNNNADLLLIADYGHGLLSPKLIELLGYLPNFLAVNTQANAGNRGYNTLSKYPRLDFFTANSGELSLELRNKNLNYKEVMPALMNKLGASKAVLTLGADGLLIFQDNKFEEVPAFANKVIDKVGAGDSVFAISSLLTYLGAPLPIIGLISNLVAAHEVAQFGHQKSLTLGDLRKQIKSMLS